MMNKIIEKYPLVSVIIPTLNEERHIKSCLNSVFDQMYPSTLLEIFVIDGESTDKTVEIVKELQINHPNLFLLNNKKRIQSVAFNMGIDNSKGEIIIRLDAHCTFDSKYILYCVENHMESEYGNVGGYWSVKPGSDTLTAKVIAIINTSTFGLGGATYRVGRTRKMTDSVPFGAFPRKVISIIGKMKEDLSRGEDNEYNSRIRKAGFKILFDPRITAYYYSRQNFKLFLKQMYDNGFSIGVLLRVSKRSVSFRHLVPSAFLFTLIAGVSLSFFYSFFKFALLLLLFVYFILILISGIMRFSKHEIKLIPVYFYGVCLVHLYYGIGTLYGLIKGKYFALG